MKIDDLVLAIKNRVADPSRRRDSGLEFIYSTPGPASQLDMDAMEARMKLELPELQYRMLSEISDGEVGPGYGLFPARKKESSVIQMSVVDAWVAIGRLMDVEYHAVVPLCDWGDAIWSAVDVRTDSMVTLFGEELFGLDFGIVEFFEMWVGGVSVWNRIVKTGKVEIVDPFIRKKRMTDSVVGAHGARIDASMIVGL